MSRRHKRGSVRIYVQPNGEVDLISHRFPHDKLVIEKFSRTLASVWVRRYVGTKVITKVTPKQASQLERIFIKHMLRKKEKLGEEALWD